MPNLTAAATPIITAHVAAARTRGVAEDVLARATADALKVVVNGWPPQMPIDGPEFAKFCEIWITATIEEHRKAPEKVAPVFRTSFAKDIGKRLANGPVGDLAARVAEAFERRPDVRKASPFARAFLDVLLARSARFDTWLESLLQSAADEHDAVADRKHDYTFFEWHAIVLPTKTRSTWTLHVDVHDHDMMASVEMDGWHLRYIGWSD